MDSDHSIIGWHWLSSNRRLGYGDGRKVVAGATLSVENRDPEERRFAGISVCGWGLHAGVTALAAASYAPGDTVSHVRLWGELDAEGDPTEDYGDYKFAAEHRACLAVADATEVVSAMCDRLLEQMAALVTLTPFQMRALGLSDTPGALARAQHELDIARHTHATFVASPETERALGGYDCHSARLTALVCSYREMVKALIFERGGERADWDRQLDHYTNTWRAVWRELNADFEARLLQLLYPGD